MKPTSKTVPPDEAARILSAPGWDRLLVEAKNSKEFSKFLWSNRVPPGTFSDPSKIGGTMVQPNFQIVIPDGKSFFVVEFSLPEWRNLLVTWAQEGGRDTATVSVPNILLSDGESVLIADCISAHQEIC